MIERLRSRIFRVRHDEEEGFFLVFFTIMLVLLLALAGLAVDVGYADHAHLTRECVRLTGLSPSELLGGSFERCECGHDHAAAYKPFLATRRVPPLGTRSS